jgi:hypothetical protein
MNAPARSPQIELTDAAYSLREIAVIHQTIAGLVSRMGRLADGFEADEDAQTFKAYLDVLADHAHSLHLHAKTATDDITAVAARLGARVDEA